MKTVKHTALFTIIVLTVSFTLSSCKRRALTEADNNVMVSIEIDTDIINHTVEELPSMMRVMFFDSSTGKFATQAFVSPEGGTVNVVPGKTYDVLTYNFDTESTVITGENDFGKIHATTNDVPESYKDKLKSRGSKFDNERIVFEPDHLFVGLLRNAYIPARGIDSDPVLLEMKAKTIVESWKIIISKVQGIEWVADISGVVSGLSEGNWISTRDRMNEDVSVFFETMETKSDGTIEIKFNTFGYNPKLKQVISLVIVDISGHGHEFNIDASEKFIGNEEQTIEIITDDIIIEEPEEGDSGGGLQPDVDDWENIENDIII